jgi:hypothetical protein
MKTILLFASLFFTFISFSQKITFKLTEKRIHYTDLSSNDIKLVDIIEPTNSVLTFNIKDSTMTLQKNGEISVTKLSKITKQGHQYFFESISKYVVDPSKSVITYYMIDCRKQEGTEKYDSFSIPNLIHVTDFKGFVLTR